MNAVLALVLAAVYALLYGDAKATPDAREVTVHAAEALLGAALICAYVARRRGR